MGIVEQREFYENDDIFDFHQAGRIAARHGVLDEFLADFAMNKNVNCIFLYDWLGY